MASEIMIGQVPVIIEREENIETFASGASNGQVNQNIEPFGSSSSGASNQANQNIEPFGSSSTDCNGQISNPKKLVVRQTNVLSFASDDELDNELELNSGAKNTDVDIDDGAKGDVLKRKRYHRHTTHQIQEMEAFFKECPHPNETQRRELGRELGLEPLQVKFWFQNKRTQIKAQVERMENTQLKNHNERLHAENMIFREALVEAGCPSCGGPQAVAHSFIEANELRIENARLREEIDRIGELVVQFFANTFANQDNALANQDLNVPHQPINFDALDEELDAGAFGGEEQPNVEGDVSEEEDLVMSSDGPNMFDKRMIINLVDKAIEELIQLTQMDNPLWLSSIDKRHSMLNERVYNDMFPRMKGFATLPSFRVEATRDTDVIMINQMHLIEVLMSMEKFLAVFSSMVSKGSLLEVISTGNEARYDGALHLITAEYQVLTPTVPTRESTFARYCRKLEENTWAVVDVSFEDMYKTHMLNKCHRMPSGCIIQAVTNDYSRVTWIEHVELRNEGVHPMGKPFVDSCLAFGARRWLAVLERQCECLATIAMPNFPPNDINTTVLSNPRGRTNILKLGEKMVISFCGGMTPSTAYSCLKQTKSGGEEVRIMIKINKSETGQPCETVLSAATSFWIPVQQGVVFNFLRDETTRKEWDVLAKTGDIREFVHITNGHRVGNYVSLLQVTDTNAGSNRVILQECSTDPTSCSVIYALLDPYAVKTILSDGTPENIKLLPSGFTIYPSERPPLPLGLMNDGTIPADLDASTHGSLVTVAFQVPVDPSTSTMSVLSFGSVALINNHIESTVQRLKHALLSNIV